MSRSKVSTEGRKIAQDAGLGIWADVRYGAVQSDSEDGETFASWDSEAEMVEAIRDRSEMTAEEWYIKHGKSFSNGNP